MCEAQQVQINHMVGVIEGLREERNAILEQIKQLPKWVDEYFYDPNNTIATVTRQSNNLERITSFISFVANGQGTITLGDRVFSVPQGLFVMNNISLLLRMRDTRKIVSSGPAGPISLELMGEEMGDGYIW